MRQSYPKFFYVTGFMIASLIAGAVFFLTNHLDFIVKAFETTKFNLPNVCYAILRLISGILIPAIFIAPQIFRFSRIRITKALFWALGVLQLLTVTWIFYFYAEGYPALDLFSNSIITEFQEADINPFVSAKIFWDTYDIISVLFTLILSAGYIALGITFDDNRKIVRWLCVGVALFKILVPILYSLISTGVVFSSLWFTTNFVEFIALIAFTVAIIIASTDDATWSISVWGEPLFGSQPNPLLDVDDD